jgi:hypothetical protein
MRAYPYERSGPAPPSVAKTTFVVICGALLIVLIFTVAAVFRLQIQVAALRREVAKSQDAMVGEINKIRGLSSVMASANRRTLKSIRDELDSARQDVQASAGQARLEAQVNVQRLARELESATLREEQRQRDLHDLMTRQMADAHQAAVASDARINDVRNEVGFVKSEVAQAKNSLSEAVSDLKRVVGDMGVMSGLIATNERELEVLKGLGDRNYTEFRLVKAREPQVVNGIAIALKRADVSARRFTLEVTAEDVRVQKRDRTLNEPVQFYVAKRKQPYEIVVNTIGKNEISGYLATPKRDVERE